MNYGYQQNYNNQGVTAEDVLKEYYKQALYYVKSSATLTIKNYTEDQLKIINDIISKDNISSFIYNKIKSEGDYILEFKNDKKANSVKMEIELELKNAEIVFKTKNNFPKSLNGYLGYDVGQKYVRKAKARLDEKTKSKLENEVFPTLKKEGHIVNVITDTTNNTSTSTNKVTKGCNLTEYYKNNKDNIKPNSNLEKLKDLPVVNQNLKHVEIEALMSKNNYQVEESFRKMSNKSGANYRKKSRY